MNRIGEDALPRMESVRAFGRKRFFRLASRAGLGLRTLHLHHGKIIDRSRPGKFGVIECRVVASRSGELGEWHDEKNEVPQGRRDQSAARNPPLNPTVPEESVNQKILWNA